MTPKERDDKKFAAAFRKMGLEQPTESAVRLALVNAGGPFEADALAMLAHPGLCAEACNEVFGKAKGFDRMDPEVVVRVAELMVRYVLDFPWVADLAVPAKGELVITAQTEEAMSEATEAAAAAGKGKGKGKTAPAKPKEKKRTRADVTHEMLHRKSGVTVTELVAAFDKEFGEGSGKENTARLALSKVPKERGYKVEKTKSEKRGDIYKVAA